MRDVLLGEAGSFSMPAEVANEERKKAVLLLTKSFLLVLDNTVFWQTVD